MENVSKKLIFAFLDVAVAVNRLTVMERDLCRDAVGRRITELQRAVIGIRWAYEQTRLCCRSKTVSSCCVYKRRQSVFYVQMSEQFFQPSSLLSSLSSQSPPPRSTHWDVKYSIQHIHTCVCVCVHFLFVIVWMHVVGILLEVWKYICILFFLSTVGLECLCYHGQCAMTETAKGFQRWQSCLLMWGRSLTVCVVTLRTTGLETTWTEPLWSRDDDAKRLRWSSVAVSLYRFIHVQTSIWVTY